MDKKTFLINVNQFIAFITSGAFLLFILGIYIGYTIGLERGQQRGYKGCRSNLEVAIEDYPAGLQKKIFEDLENQEEAIRDLLQED